MDKLFLQIINMSITSSYVIIFVILIRFFLKKVPKIYSYSLWSIVWFRLISPFSFESMFSFISINTKTVPRDIIYTPTPQIHSGITAIDRIVNNSLPTPVVGASINPIQVWILIGKSIWILGIVALMIYSLVSTLKLSKRLKSSRLIRDNIYEANTIETPFVFGIIRPKIYLPLGLSENERSYIIKHEETHIIRYDHMIKFFSFLIVSVHWFNPLAWIAFIFMSKDMELSCDERVIRQMGSKIKKDYSSSLLSLSTSRKIIGGSPLAFGGKNTKGRIKNILNYKKPGFWVSLVGIIVIIVVAIGLLSDPKEKTSGLPDTNDFSTIEEYAEKFVEDTIEMYSPKAGQPGGFEIVDSKIVNLEKLATFDDILATPIEIWGVEFRLKPKDMDKVMIAGGMGEADGWITEEGSMGKPVFVFTYEGDLIRHLGNIYTGESNMNSLASQEIAIRTMLENNNQLSNVTYEGNHVLIKFPLSTGETSQLFLSQPVIKGDKGIWVVERWMDGNGNIYHTYPETDMSLKDYYEKEQKEFDNGEKQYLGDPLEAGYDFIINSLGQAPGGRRYLDIKNPATIEEFLETPLSHYIGYIMDFSQDKTWINLDNVEYLTTDDEERLLELKINPDTLDNGYYINNPTSYPNSLKLVDGTEYNFINEETVRNKKTTKEKFIQYIEELDYEPLFHVYTKDGYVTKIEEQYLP